MPTPQRTLSVEDIRRHIRQRAFRNGGTQRSGLEIEWLPVSLVEPSAHVDASVLRRVVAELDPFPDGSRLTMEPGGQLEIASPPLAGVAATCRAVDRTSAVLRRRLEAQGIGLVGLGLEPLRPLRRLVREPRYDAMEAYFDATAGDGRRMMCGTASLQLNVDAGPADEIAARWRTANAVGPIWCAMFANSPVAEGHDTGWASARLGTWWGMDPGRTAAVAGTGPPADTWADYALDAPVMLLRASEDHYLPGLETMAFSEWSERGHAVGYPGTDDLDYHLSTLFPPVRPRGWLELRMFDALPDPWWKVVVALGTAALADSSTRAAVLEAAGPVRDRWEDASRLGLADPAVARAALDSFDAAAAALPRVGAGDEVAAIVEAFRARYVALGRSPADDRREEWNRGQRFPAVDGAREPAWS